nr:hypothetical protein [Acidiferrobacterales bacterium]
MNKTLSLPELRDILVNLHDPIDQLIGDALDFEQRAQILERGYFRPQEDEDLAYWLARYLSVRTELLGIVCSVDSRASVPFRKISTLEHWRCFVLGYTAACQLVRLDRYFLWEFATHKLIQRKLNEAYPEYRIPPKTYTNVFQHFTDPSLAFRLYEAIWFARLFSWRLRFLRKDPVVGEFVSRRKEFEEYLDKSKRNYLKRTALFFRHSFRRRFASAKQKTLFGILERLGRTASEINIDSPKYINSEIKRELSEILEPGDILVTRHRY